MESQFHIDGGLSDSPVYNERVVPLDCSTRHNIFEKLGILDAPCERRFQLLTDLASSLLDAPVALISLVTDQRQFFLSSTGLPQPWAELRETPLSHSYCQHVVERNQPLVISDSENHLLVADNLATSEIGVKAYLGCPLVTDDGSVLGSFCAIGANPRNWNEGDLVTLQKLAALAVAEINARAELQQKEAVLHDWLMHSQKMDAIGRSVSGLAHDFNNTLAVIRGHAEVIMASRSSPKSIESSARKTESTVVAAQQVTRQLLKFGRPDQCDKTPISLKQLVENSWPLLESVPNRSIQVVFEECGPDGLVQANSNQIHQVVLNLFNNACHALQTNSGTIVLVTGQEELSEQDAQALDVTPGKYMKLSIEDDGAGIPADKLNLIFEPYYSSKPVEEGTGLGLWAVFEIVRDHNARITVESSINKGTKFSIFFPEFRPTTATPE